MSDELRQPFALLPRRSDPWIQITKPTECSVKKFICGRGTSTRSLPVERPTKNELRRAILFSSHSSEPVVDECRLPDSGPGNDCNDVDILVCPCTIQKSNILLSTKNITSCNGQSGYGNLLRCKSCWRLASSDTRINRADFLEALTSDSTSCVDSACYRRHRLQKFCWVLKAPPGVLLKKHLQ